MIVIYGAYGYTGRLIVAEARRRGLRPVLSGRDPDRLDALAREVGLDALAVDLTDGDGLCRLLDQAAVVVHCAGPFVYTWEPMARACIASGTHYLDITGEATVFEALAGLGDEAANGGVMLLPGVGFDVVPTDCLAAHLVGRLPEARRLTLAFKAGGRPSRGTANTMVEHAHRGGMARKDGVLTNVPPAWKTRQIDFGDGPLNAMTIPWGDVVTAWYSTSIPDIEVYTAVSPRSVRRIRRGRWIAPLLGLGPIRWLLKRRVAAGPPGPSERSLAEDASLVWGEVADAEGNVATARLRGPQGYRWTAMTAVEAADRVAKGQATPGFQTPSTAFGADFVMEVGEALREDGEP